jgi:hypothetical protein
MLLHENYQPKSKHVMTSELSTDHPFLQIHSTLQAKMVGWSGFLFLILFILYLTSPVVSTSVTPVGLCEADGLIDYPSHLTPPPRDIGIHFPCQSSQVFSYLFPIGTHVCWLPLNQSSSSQLVRPNSQHTLVLVSRLLTHPMTIILSW